MKGTLLVNSSSSLRRFGLTLVELLLVIGIVVVLVGIMFLVGREVKHRVYEIKCLSQMRQLHSAILLYLQDHDQVFPAYLGDEIFPYVKDYSIFYCPVWYAVFGEGRSFEQIYKEGKPWEKTRYGYIPRLVNQYYRIYREKADPEGDLLGVRRVTAPWEYYYAQRGDDIPVIH